MHIREVDDTHWDSLWSHNSKGPAPSAASAPWAPRALSLTVYVLKLEYSALPAPPASSALRALLTQKESGLAQLILCISAQGRYLGTFGTQVTFLSVWHSSLAILYSLLFTIVCYSHITFQDIMRADLGVHQMFLLWASISKLNQSVWLHRDKDRVWERLVRYFNYEWYKQDLHSGQTTWIILM